MDKAPAWPGAMVQNLVQLRARAMVRVAAPGHLLDARTSIGGPPPGPPRPARGPAGSPWTPCKGGLTHVCGRKPSISSQAHLTDRLGVFERMLNLPDPDLQDMILHPELKPAGDFAELVAQVRVFHGLEPCN